MKADARPYVEYCGIDFVLITPPNSSPCVPENAMSDSVIANMMGYVVPVLTYVMRDDSIIEAHEIPEGYCISQREVSALICGPTRDGQILTVAPFSRIGVN